MQEKYYDFLNCNEVIKERIKLCIESFVAFYGEENSKDIMNFFENTLFLAYQSPSDYATALNKIINMKVDELATEVLTTSHSPFTKEELYGNVPQDPKKENLPINQLYDFLKETSKGQEQRHNDFLTKGYNEIKNYFPNLTYQDFLNMVKNKTIPDSYEFIPEWVKSVFSFYSNLKNCDREYFKKFSKIKDLLLKIDSDITFENCQEKFQEESFSCLNKLFKSHLLSCQRFTAFQEELTPYIEEVKHNQLVSKELKDYFYTKYLTENMALINENQNEINKILAEKKFYLLNSETRMIFNDSFLFPSALKCFTKEQSLLLESPATKENIKNQIKRDRIRYFNFYGIQLGTDYNNYVESIECQKLWPSEELADNLERCREKIKKEYDKAYFESIAPKKPFYQEAKNEKFLNLDTGINYKLYTEDRTMIHPCFKKDENGNIKLFPILLINFNSLDSNHIDHDICHELNHLYELYYEFLNSDTYTITCGWDTFTESLDESSTSKELRPYESFNEIINELISQEITNKMHENNIYLFDNPNNCQTKNITGYEYSAFLVQDFYEYFKKDIIKGRKGGNIKHIWSIVGKDNFEELNKLFQTFADNFQGMKIYSVLSDLSKGLDTEATRIYHDLENQSKIIFKKMQEYSTSYYQELGKEKG